LPLNENGLTRIPNLLNSKCQARPLPPSVIYPLHILNKIKRIKRLTRLSLSTNPENPANPVNPDSDKKALWRIDALGLFLSIWSPKGIKDDIRLAIFYVFYYIFMIIKIVLKNDI
jgi:hypothetical protein